ncbi:unnamed protein product [Arabidopsis thaliana]|uniref:Retrovirus-related Pol polyprotein from transposon TNT 1-94-like beta-barrel domain-containing protein n=2 Tax=Arabidopsis thaliana TaxID=3702 RepID=Q9LJD2_ARATH|nr:unnamed protein product [Arabidopsis thaliana]CAD5323693.1 unnamed protein product [Arabidopsis thaliana]
MAAANKQHDAFSDDFDYEIWSSVTKATLTEKELWDVVENGVPPDPSKIPELATKIQPEELSRWRDLAVKDMKALQILQSSSLTDSAFRKTLSASSAKDLWDSLEKGNNEQAKLRRLEKQFEEIKREENESLDSYIDRITEIVGKLRVLKVEKSEYEICKKVFASMSDSYGDIHSMMEELMNVHGMTSASLCQYFFLNGYDFESVNEEVFLRLLKNLRLKSKSKKWCDVCYKIDHNLEECNRRIQRYVIIDENVWMVNWEVPNHMTPNEKYFTTLDRTFKADIGTDDGKVLMVGGRGDVKIKMKEGKKKTINNVIFVPELNRNLLSVPQMRERGCSFIVGARGELIVYDRTGQEFGETMRDERSRALFLRLEVIEGNLNS